MIGVFVTAFYSFRLMFMTFHGKPRWERTPRMQITHERARDACGSRPWRARGHAHDDHAHDDHGHGHHGGPPLKSPWAGLVRSSCWRFRRSSSAPSPSGRCCSAAASASPSSSCEHNDVLHEIGESSMAGWHFALHAHESGVPSVGSPACSPPGRCTSSGRTCPASSTPSSSRCAGCSRTSIASTGSTRTCSPPAAACWARFSGRSATSSSSTGRRRWLGEHGRLHRRHRAPRAERFPLFLCVLDGHRPGRDAGLVPDARLI